MPFYDVYDIITERRCWRAVEAANEDEACEKVATGQADGPHAYDIIDTEPYWAERIPDTQPEPKYVP